MQLGLSQSTRNGLRTLRAQAAVFERVRGFDRCLRRLVPDAEAPVSIDAAIELFAHWGDPLTQSDEGYLRSCLAEATRTRGPIVLCGASLMTLILGQLCNTQNPGARQVWCLESDPHWANVVRSWLTQYGIGAAHVITSRAHLFDGYVWYAVDPERLAPGIRLVFCEGGRATPGGAVGALHRLQPRLAADATILARKVTRAGDVKALNAWAQARGAACVVVDSKEGFVKIRCGHPTANGAPRSAQAPSSSSSESTPSRSRKMRSP